MFNSFLEIHLYICVNTVLVLLYYQCSYYLCGPVRLLLSLHGCLKAGVVLLATEPKTVTCFISNGINLTQVNKFFCLTESLIILSHFVFNFIGCIFPETFLLPIFFIQLIVFWIQLSYTFCNFHIQLLNYPSAFFYTMLSSPVLGRQNKSFIVLTCI
jgi:hypothetical protein